MKIIAGLLLISSICAFADDPSLQPLPDPTGKAKYAERSRIIVDLDGDGVMDLLLSGSPDTFGTMGGPWTVHLNRDGDYKRIGEVWAHPLAIAFEPDQARIQSDPETRRYTRIWVYLRAGGSRGSFGYFRVGENSVDDMASIEIYLGNVENAIGRAIYEATFKKSPIPFKVQRSTTADDGTVTWNESKR
ncbi:hypothetical protein JIN85_18925 [Luteolibacter pohnpeiensis]|uniref:VCBS repeat-containing protein n=2 Tax=Luteolibacter pohnpeiensis TaxID=454153 RepID=A0A934VWD4_9BACT|nr:hypothetical protein [Luteolibacter pohnpeiensis]